MSARTRIEVVTEGILTRLIQSDPELAGIGAILFDEFHERHLHGDLGAALALDVQASLRPDLRLVIMSATLDGERVARWFDAPRLTSAGRSYPVRIEYPPARAQRGMAVPAAPHCGKSADGHRWRCARVSAGAARDRARAATAVMRLLASIAFSERAGKTSLGNSCRCTANCRWPNNMPRWRPRRPERGASCSRRTSPNPASRLPGIRAVIDLGLAREPRFDPNSGFTRLETVTISQASADQRAGRAGRVAAGIAYRLWPQSQRLEPSRRAEIAQVELSALALELAAWGSADLRWLDAPPPGALASARDLLTALGAIDADGRMTELGRAMLDDRRDAASGCRRAARIRRRSARWPAICSPWSKHAIRCAAMPARSDDFRQRHAALLAYRRDGARAARTSGADAGALAAIDQAATRLAPTDSMLRDARPSLAQPSALSAASRLAPAIGNILIHAFPDRIARQDREQSAPLSACATAAARACTKIHCCTASRGWS